MGFFRNVVCAVDGSGASLHAAVQAFALGPEATYAAVAVTPELSAGHHAGATSRADKEVAVLYREGVQKVLDQVRLAGDGAGVRLATALERGAPHEGILGMAEILDADLIVLGARRGRYLRRRVLGGTAARVIGYGRRDVLVIPEEASLDPEAPVLAAMDCSECGLLALDKAVAVCGASGTPLALVCVYSSPLDLVGFPPAPAACEDLARSAEACLAGGKRRAEKAGVDAETMVRRGEPWARISDAAGEMGAGVVVVGSHGRTGLARLLMGSVAERVVETSPCPVLVVRSEVRPRRRGLT